MEPADALDINNLENPFIPLAQSPALTEPRDEDEAEVSAFEALYAAWKVATVAFSAPGNDGRDVETALLLHGLYAAEDAFLAAPFPAKRLLKRKIEFLEDALKNRNDCYYEKTVVSIKADLLRFGFDTPEGKEAT